MLIKNLKTGVVWDISDKLLIERLSKDAGYEVLAEPEPKKEEVKEVKANAKKPK